MDPPLATKLRPTDNGLALHKIGTLHVPNRKLTELQLKPDQPQDIQQQSLPPLGSSQLATAASGAAAAEDMRSPTPDYPESSASGKRGSRPRSKKNHKAPQAPSTPALSAKSMDMSHPPEPTTTGSAKRGKLKLFKTKSDPKRTDSERLRAKSMEYLRTDPSEDMQEVKRRHSREDLSGDESLLAVTKTGPVTVFSSQKKLGEEDDWEEMPRIEKAGAKRAEQHPPKQFYFGMTPGDVAVATAPAPAKPGPATLDLEEESRRVMEEFDAVLSDSRTTKSEDEPDLAISINKRSKNQPSKFRLPSPPATAYTDDDEESQDIALNLRPTLPKKPQQLPRFSPSAAWRALGQQPDSGLFSRKLDSSKASDMSAMDLSDEEEDEDVMEERINKNSRPVAPHPPRNINEKSADSGISGDAGSPDAGAMGPSGTSRGDKPLAMSSPVPQQQNWTPQQDLMDDDDSSSEADVISPAPNSSSKAGKVGPPKIMPKSQMFNDSTDTPGSSISGKHNHRGRKYKKRSENPSEVPQKYNSLRKLKRSVSGAFANAFRGGRSGSKSPEESSLDDGNWVLSRSAPNSIVNGSVGESSLRKLHRSEADLIHQQILQQQQSQMLHPQGGMLIHQYPAYSQPALTQRIVYLPQYDSRPTRSNHHFRMPGDRQTEMIRRARSADALYLESQQQLQQQQASVQRRTSATGKKFTFQSTVRMQEKRALEQRLSREAEMKERKRIQEVQAMQRVEEEFQRKRAREKANIRHQLRILQYSSDLQEQANRSARLDPEGAPSSISHNRTSSDEIQQAKVASRSSPTEHKQQQRSSSGALVQQPMMRRPSDEPARSNSRMTREQENMIQQDYRRDAIVSSSRTRSAAPPPPPPQNPPPERNNNNIKKPSNIYKRLAEITSEEESISSPPPVPLLVVSSNKSSPSRVSSAAMNGHAPAPITSSSSSGPASRRSNAAPPPPSSSSNNNNKVMTQELSEYRQERREYRDYRSPRPHVANQAGMIPLAADVCGRITNPILHPCSVLTGRYVSSSGLQQQQQQRGTPSGPSSSGAITHHGKMMTPHQSDNYRWEFAHGGRAVPSGKNTYVAAPPPVVPVWHHPPLVQPAQVVRGHHDYAVHHRYYKMPGEAVVMMHRTPQQQRHH